MPDQGAGPAPVPPVAVPGPRRQTAPVIPDEGSRHVGEATASTKVAPGGQTSVPQTPVVRDDPAGPVPSKSDLPTAMPEDADGARTDKRVSAHLDPARAASRRIEPAESGAQKVAAKAPSADTSSDAKPQIAMPSRTAPPTWRADMAQSTDLTRQSESARAPSANPTQAPDPAGLALHAPSTAPGRPVGATPGQAWHAPSAVPLDQVSVLIERAAKAGEDRIRIRLHPADLGKVDVKLHVNHDGAVKALVIADRAETLDLLQRDARGLERALHDAGLKADSGSLSFSLRGDTQHGAAGRDQGGAPATHPDPQSAETDEQGGAAPPPDYRPLGGGRALDIRV